MGEAEALRAVHSAAKAYGHGLGHWSVTLRPHSSTLSRRSSDGETHPPPFCPLLCSVLRPTCGVATRIAVIEQFISGLQSMRELIVQLLMWEICKKRRRCRQRSRPHHPIHPRHGG